MVRAYIRCSMCRWEDVLYSGRESVYGLRKEIAQLRRAAIKGVPAHRRLAQARERLRKEVAKGASSKREQPTD